MLTWFWYSCVLYLLFDSTFSAVTLFWFVPVVFIWHWYTLSLIQKFNFTRFCCVYVVLTVKSPFTISQFLISLHLKSSFFICTPLTECLMPSIFIYGLILRKTVYKGVDWIQQYKSCVQCALWTYDQPLCSIKEISWTGRFFTMKFVFLKLTFCFVLECAPCFYQKSQVL